MRLILDTSVLVAGFRSHTGFSRRLLELIPSQRFQLIASPALYLEYEAVLTRHEQMEIHGLTVSQIAVALEGMAAFTDKVRVRYIYRPQLRDANDEMVLEAAINGAADAIVTYNQKDFTPAARRFGIEVLTPRSILQERLFL